MPWWAWVLIGVGAVYWGGAVWTFCASWSWCQGNGLTLVESILLALLWPVQLLIFRH